MNVLFSVRRVLVVIAVLMWGIAINPAQISAAGPPTEPTWTAYTTPVAICNCANAEVIALSDGRLRLYYSYTSQTPSIVSKISSDGGKTWIDEPGERLTQAGTPDVVSVSAFLYRMYFKSFEIPGSVTIRSATSTDGLSWTKESGNRLEPGGEVQTVNKIGGHSTIRLSDGTYMMSYIGSDSAKAGAGASVYWAISTDGLTFTKRGMVLDGTPMAKFNFGYDGSELALWDDGTVKLYVRGEKGIERVIFNGASFSTIPTVIIANGGTTQNPFIPGDPSLLRFGGRWHLFHGSGPQVSPINPAEGIYEAGYLAPLKRTITCIQGSKSKKVRAESPACPSGYKLATTIICKKGNSTTKVVALQPRCPKGYQKSS